MRHLIQFVSSQLVLCASVAGFCQSPYTPDAGKVGLPINGVFSGGSIDTVQINNGNLHVDIPLLHLPGVGMDADFHLVFDNQIFTVTPVPYYWSAGNNGNTPDLYWGLITMSRYLASVNDPLTGFLKIGRHTETWACGNPNTVWQGNLTYVDFVSASGPSGTPHSFPASGYPTNLIGPCTPTNYYPTQSHSTDASGSFLTMDNAGNEVSLLDKHGSKYTYGSSANGGNVPVYPMNPNVPHNPVYAPVILSYYPLTQIEDTNGNRIGRNASGMIDTLGRQITETAGPAFTNTSIAVEALGSQFGSITYSDQNGNQQTISIGYGAVSINLALLCGSSLAYSPANCGPALGTTAGTITVQMPTSVALQNGDTYQISYEPNGLGEIASITLPTGGEINYAYGSVEIRGGNISRPVLTRTVSTGTQSSTWTFNPGGSYGSTSVVTDPYGNDTVYTCSLAWPDCYMTQEVMYNGRFGTGTPLVTRSNSYTEYACAFLPTAEVFTWNESGQVTETDTTYDSFAETTTMVCPNINNGTLTSTTGRGNVKTGMVYDYGIGSHGSLISNTQYAYLHESNSSYLTANIVDLPSQVSEYNSATMNSSTLVAQTSTQYDTFTSGGQSGLSSNAWSSNHDSTYGTGITLRGLPTSVSKYVNASSSVVTYANYNVLGQPTVSTDGRGNQTSLSYSTATPPPPAPGNSDLLTTITLPATTTNGTTVNHIVKQYQDPKTSLDMAKTDQNGNSTTYSYDSRMRPLVETRPTGGGTTTNSYPDPTHVVTVVTEDATPRSATTTVVLDEIGRKISSSTTSDTACGPLEVDTYYDLMSRVQSISNPHCVTSQITDGYTNYSYDSIGRLTTKQNPDGSSQAWNFSGSTIDFFDETSRHWQHTYDAATRLIQVREPNGSSTINNSRAAYTGSSSILETDYKYDALGNLLRVDQWGGANGSSGDHVRQFAYDGLSRLLGSNNPESASSQHPAAQSCTGTQSGTLWTTCYTYDSNGNVTKKTDNRGISINYNYDTLNRLLSKTYTDSTPSVSFGYDLSTVSGNSNDVGEVTQATVTSGASVLAQSNTYAFDTMGRLKAEQQCTPATNCGSSPYQLGYTYDWAGKLTSATFPSNVGLTGQPLTLTYTYDQAERLLTTNSNWTGDNKHPSSLFQAPPSSTSLAAYGPMGLLNASLGFNSSAETTTATLQRGYDNRGRAIYGVYGTGATAITDSAAAGNITISGSETQVTKTSGVSSTTLNDPTQGMQYGSSPYVCYNYNNIPPTQFNATSYYAGIVIVTIQSPTPFAGSGSWGQNDENQTDVRTAIVSGLNASGSPVVATLNANKTITLASKATGISANYPVTVSQTQGQVQIVPTPPNNCH